ncbi:phage minor tail protein L [Chromobacterium amazonense]|uniref:Phage minor tail protein L n=1 Tax=Chromobacterium amazonense TaxID=1382803 RepID=A0A2S9X714_9NEIS|nr:phage minor tail protein L [Chromobacterium amazonense]PRP71508.1 phage minor tail protein L [Chromobacterium amazonense]
MQLQAEIQKLAPDALVVLYELRPPVGVSLPVQRFTASGNGQALRFQGQVYEPWAIEATGFEASSKGPVARPRLSVSNIATLPDGRTLRGLFTALVQQHQGLVGWTLIRRVTNARFIEGGALAGAPEMHPEEIWLINRCESDTGDVVSFELRSSLDMTGKRAPGILATTYCPAHVLYRSADCGYQGSAMFDANDKPTKDRQQDVCAKRLSSCRCRNNLANFGGFPGMRRYTD